MLISLIPSYLLYSYFYRHTATRKNRLEGLRKGKATGTTDPQQQQKRDNALNNTRDAQQNQKNNKSVYRKGRRGVSRNKQHIYNEDDSDGATGGTIDTSIAFVCINRLAEEFNTEESIKTFYR